jgi:hypothetical protein
MKLLWNIIKMIGCLAIAIFGIAYFFTINPIMGFCLVGALILGLIIMALFSFGSNEKK